MYNQWPFFNMPSYRPAMAQANLPVPAFQAPISSISYTPIASSARLLFKDDTWEIQFVTTTYKVNRHTVTKYASSMSVDYIDKYMIIKYKNSKIFETIYLN